MPKDRREYVYVAYRIDPYDPQNLGDYAIARDPKGWGNRQTYHYGSVDYPAQEGRADRTGRIINRSAQNMPVISTGSRIWNECIKAVRRLQAEEEHVEG